MKARPLVRAPARAGERSERPARALIGGRAGSSRRFAPLGGAAPRWREKRAASATLGAVLIKRSGPERGAIEENFRQGGVANLAVKLDRSPGRQPRSLTWPQTRRSACRAFRCPMIAADNRTSFSFKGPPCPPCSLPIKLGQVELANRIVVSPDVPVQRRRRQRDRLAHGASRHAGQLRRRPRHRRGHPRRAPRPHHPRLHRALFRSQRGGAAARHRSLPARRHRQMGHPDRACRPQGVVAAAVGGRRCR